MALALIIAFLSLIGLMVIHEFGHFILAKKFGVKVEEFGVGYPPRIFGKKIGETIYSVNLLPFGAFVKIYGETDREEDPWSFATKKIWQRVLIVLGGVISFWVVSAILLSIVMALGAPTVVGDDEGGKLVNPSIQIMAISSDSPAQKAGIKVGDVVKGYSLFISSTRFPGNKVKDFQAFIDSNKGKEISLAIQRGKDVFDVSLIPRLSPPKDEGPLGVALVRTALVSYPWYIAPLKGVEATWNLTVTVVDGWAQALINLFHKRPTGVQLMGPVGIFGLFTQVSQLGAIYFLQFVAIISVFVALSNLIPIPVTDGGKLLFLIIEKFRGRPIGKKLDQNLNVVFFALLLLLMVWVTVQDIGRLF